MNADLAREIITQALNDEVWEADVPEDDDKTISDAEEIVEMSQDAWDQNVRGPEVEAILKLASRDDSDEEDEEEEKPKKKSAAKKSSGGRPEKKADPEPEEDDEDESDDDEESESAIEPWDDYKDDGVPDIIEAIEIWAEEEDWDQIRNLIAYERDEHKNRVRVIKAATAALPAEDEDEGDEEMIDPEVEEDPDVTGESDDDEDESDDDDEDEEDSEDESEEPFEGYDSLKVTEVKEAMEAFLDDEEYDDEQKIDTLETVIEYEKDNGSRSSLIKYLQQHLESLNESDDDEDEEDVDEETAAEEEGEAEDSAESEADAGGKSADKGGKSGGKKARTPAAEGKKSAGTGDGDDEEGYDTLIEVVRETLKAERLHVPGKIKEDEVDLPFDLTRGDDAELQSLFSAFAAYSYRAGYLLMEYEAIAQGCKIAAEEVVTAYIAEHGTEGETMTVVKAEAEQDERVQMWRKRQRRNDVLADAQRRQRDNYDKVCERLSRIGTLRDDEWKRTSASAVKGKPRVGK